jgi:SDR family mycofactocin-dependent oxidoreductase
MGRVAGKVALITGAARGQGRSHAVRLAGEGADIIAVDLCRDIDSVPYGLATPEDLAETVRLVQAEGRTCTAVQTDVREFTEFNQAVATAIQAHGQLDIVVANAGIAPMGAAEPGTLFDVLQVNMNGVVNTIAASIDHLGAGASVVVTGSVAGLRMGRGETGTPGLNPGGAGYGFAKRTVSSLVHTLARELGPRGIRVNTVHPSNTLTPMFDNLMMARMFSPDEQAPTLESNDAKYRAMHVLDVPYVQPGDISNAVLFLASDESRYVTGQQLAVDAGVSTLEPYRGA